ncbi:hypothetical protein NADFUDRAFT_50930 [Nadsonia fulvescens var. elongata DSM 6958]|uniref:Phosphatidylinositol-glycan-specific phospholipase D n=1 Tax=Nadsonia fulvescens var. elongata DSM 6958 TaxID=857566 RepID=A0A1E3PJL8_9ASCO|nr:hypothetical protein NADFUDRAFT_50930 [Nadsonia fulvescens var. elongata DSM 6958]
MVYFPAFIPLLISLGHISTIAAAGVSVHLTVLSRSLAWLPQDISPFTSYLQSGVFFPDSFYDCLGQSDLAEEAHWPPFINVAVTYWKEKYASTPTTDEALRLKAFIYGVYLHQIADVSWHSLGKHSGFLSMLASRDFSGDINKAHAVLDTGGDMIHMNRLLKSDTALRWLKDTQWDIPMNDMLNIIELLGYNGIRNTAISFCMSRGKAALNGEINVAPSVYREYAKKSPLLFDHLEDYYLGGIQEITSTTAHCIKKLHPWFVQDIPVDPWTLCEVYDGVSQDSLNGLSLVKKKNNKKSKTQWPINIFGQSKLRDIETIIKENVLTIKNGDKMSLSHADTLSQVRFSSKDMNFLEILPSDLRSCASYFGSAIAIGRFEGSEAGTQIAISAPFQALEKSDIQNGVIYLNSASSILDNNQKEPHSYVHFGYNNYKELDFNGPVNYGKTMNVITINGLDFLLISAPGMSQIDLYHKGRIYLTITSNLTSSSYGGYGFKHFGEVVAIEDINGDGYDDIIIGTPKADLNQNHYQTGQVDILDGKNLSELINILNAPSNLESKRYVDIDDLSMIRATLPSNEINFEHGYELFGSSITFSTKLNKLIIGSEGLGKVFVYDVLVFGENREPQLILHEILNLSKFRTKFGGALLIDHEDLLLIGAPNENVGVCTQNGAIYIYKYNSLSKSYQQIRTLILKGLIDCDSFEKFGWKGILVSDDNRKKGKVYIHSSFSQNEKGAIYVLDLSTFEIEMLMTGDGSEGASFWGSSLGVLSRKESGKKDDILIVGAPMKGFGKLGSLTDQVTGGVYIYKR